MIHPGISQIIIQLTAKLKQIEQIEIDPEGFVSGKLNRALGVYI